MKYLCLLNTVMAIIFVLLATVRPAFTDLSVMGRYGNLDREGVINSEALKKFHPSYGFSESRRGVPRYIAGPALEAEKLNANVGAAAALANLILMLMIAASHRSKSAKDIRVETIRGNNQ